ncbi:MAG: deoxyribose-phosphate aldolase [Cyanobacteriota bacterium]|nr:deoxyribose-phosphate aldolase [Cyanobacteriota bacterium]
MMSTISDLAAQYDLAAAIDQTLLLTTATEQEVEEACQAADRWHFATVCVHPCHVWLARERLKGSRVRVTTVVGFPLGTTTPQVKQYEAEQAVDQGAEELDVRINLGWLKEGSTDRLHSELAEIVEATGIPIKAILETSLLTVAEKQLAAEICVDAGAMWLMTSTGWAGGATVEDVTTLWQVSQGKVGVKASGGIRTLEQAFALLAAGATRLGTSWGCELMEQLIATASP